MDARPYIGWEWSHCLNPELATTDDSGSPPAAAFIPEGSRTATLKVLRSYFSEARRFQESKSGLAAFRLSRIWRQSSPRFPRRSRLSTFGRPLQRGKATEFALRQAAMSNPQVVGGEASCGRVLARRRTAGVGRDRSLPATRRFGPMAGGGLLRKSGLRDEAF